MSTFLDLLTQKQPQFQTHQALLVLDLQNDFLHPEGKLPVSSRSGFLTRIKRLVPTFRDNAGDIIWVRTVYESDRPANDGTGDGEVVITVIEADGDGRRDEDGEDVTNSKDSSSASQGSASKTGARGLDLLKKITRKQSAPIEPVRSDPDDDPELFLSSSATRRPCCMKNTKGADIYEDVKKSIDFQNDVVVTKSHYSAFNSTQLLMTLRMRLITELYICGCMTNLSVYATALDAARHGFTINIVEDCLGFRKASRHREALRQMADIMGAFTVSSIELLTELAEQDPESNVQPGSNPTRAEPEALDDMVRKLRLSDSSSLRSGKDDEAKHSLEDSRPNSRSADSSKLPVNQNPRLNRKASAKLQKKPPTSPVPPESNSRDTPAAEAAEHTLKYKRSKIRMRKREPSVGAQERPAILDPSEKSPTFPESIGRARTSPQPTTTARTTTDDHVQSPLLSPTSKRGERSGQISPSRDGSDTKSPKNFDASSPLQSPTLPIATNGLGHNLSEASQDLQSSVSTTKSDQSPVTTPLAMPKASEIAIGEGDSYLATFVLPPQHASTIFSALYNEVRWQNMLHQTGSVPRLVCVQGDFSNDGSMPIYRHPTDHALPLLHYSPSVQLIRRQAERVVRHPLNHCLIQLYRSGQDYISEHSDKTLDIVRGSSIVNVSFGAQRTMRLRTKKSALDQSSVSFTEAIRQTHRVPLPHNSAFVLGQETNMRWLHGITQDKRAQNERSEAEKAFSGMRISLTFRHIGTYLNADSTLIWGQGATGKARDQARPVVNNDMRRTEAMVRAFGKENQATEFDWSDIYGSGFDVLNFRKLPSDSPTAALLFLSNDTIENEQVRTYLDAASFEYVAIEAPTQDADNETGYIRKVCFRDTDSSHTEVTGALGILLYLDHLRPLPHRVTADGPDDKPVETRASIARTYELLGMLGEAVDSVRSGQKWLLGSIEGYLAGDGYITGKGFSFADCAYFPVLERCWKDWDEERDGDMPQVKAYLERMRRKLSVGPPRRF